MNIYEVTSQTVEEMIKFRKPTKPTNVTRKHDIISCKMQIGKCPTCDKTVTSKSKFCSACGQHLLWQED